MVRLIFFMVNVSNEAIQQLYRKAINTMGWVFAKLFTNTKLLINNCLQEYSYWNYYFKMHYKFNVMHV